MIETGETIERGDPKRSQLDALVAQRFTQRLLISLAQGQQLLKHGLVLGIGHSEREELLRLGGRAELDSLEDTDLRLHRVVPQLEVLARRHRLDKYFRERLNERRQRLTLQLAEESQCPNRLLADVVVQRGYLPYQFAKYIV